MGKKGRKWTRLKALAGQRPDGEFANSPFGVLADISLAKPTRPEASADEEERHENDERLFMKALERFEHAARKRPNWGFKLEDLCELSKKTRNKSEKKPVEPIAPPVKAAQVPDEGTQEFLLAMRKTRPLDGRGRQIAPRPESQAAQIDMEAAFGDILAENPEFSLLYSDEYLEGCVAGLDSALMNRLREGGMSPEAHLDLHGLNAEQAFENLKVFIRDAWFKSLRVVLVVTGRGKNSPAGQGVLRRKLQEWLTHEPFKRVVVAFCTAKAYDGGPGSVYVLLRKFRKKGRIHWDCLPADADMHEIVLKH